MRQFMHSFFGIESGAEDCSLCAYSGDLKYLEPRFEEHMGLQCRKQRLTGREAVFRHAQPSFVAPHSPAR